uniref:Uncharacterized protein n=1 Tax=Salix viminalis TaxID=40686 RepID=A0A6N2N4E1_SALVM
MPAASQTASNHLRNFRFPLFQPSLRLSYMMTLSLSLTTWSSPFMRTQRLERNVLCTVSGDISQQLCLI